MKSKRVRIIISMLISITVLLTPINRNIAGSDFNNIIAEILKNENVMFFFIISVAFYYMFTFYEEKIIKNYLVLAINILYAIVLATFMLYGILFRSGLFVYSKANLLLILLKEVGLCTGFFISLEFIEIKLSEYFMSNAPDKIKPDTSKFLWLKWFTIIFICWIPYLVILYPGISNSDTGNQLVEFFNHGNWIRDDYPIGWYLYHKNVFTITNQHNFLVTVLYGSNVKIGYYIFHNAAFGLFLNSLLQVILMGAVYAYALVVFRYYCMGEKNIRKWGIFFALFPIFPITTMFITKNVLYTEALLWSSLLLARAFKNKNLFKEVSWNSLFILSLIGQLLTEKFAIYVLTIFALFILIFIHKDKNYVILSIRVITIIVVFFIGQSLFFRALNISNGDPIEGESLIIQSTAFYQKKYPKDQTNYQKYVINKVFVRKNLASLYDPVDSDPIKSSGSKKVGLQPNGLYDNKVLKGFKVGYRYKTVTKDDIRNYKQVWFQLMVKHPLILVEAFMNGSYKYLDILSLPGNSVATVPNDSLNVAHPGIYIPINNRKEWIRIEYSTRLLKVRETMSSMYNMFSKLPPFMIFTNGNLLIILTLILAIILLTLKMYKEFSILLLMIVQVPVCMLSPVNGNPRYMYPFILGFAVILGIIRCFILSKTVHKRNKL